MLVMGLDGDWGEISEVRNQGAKPIRAYTVAWLTTAGTGNIVEWRGGVTDVMLMPGQTSPRSGEGKEIEIVPLTDKLRDTLKFRRPMQAVAVFMIVSVEFTDETTYNDAPTFKALETYFERVGANVYVSPK